MFCRQHPGFVAGFVLFGCFLGLHAQEFEGRVVEDHSGKPLSGVAVRVTSAAEQPSGPAITTDAAGVFRLPQLPAGDYRVVFEKADYLRARLHLRLPAETAPPPVRLIRLGSVSGQVRDAAGNPAAGVVVFPLVESADGSLRKFRGATGGRTDAAGEYRLSGLPPGRYAAAVSFASSGKGAGGAVYPGGERPELLTISGGEEHRGISFAASPGPFRSVSGTVEGQPGATLVVTLVRAAVPVLPLALVRTEPDGSFRLDGIEPGVYELLASGPIVSAGPTSMTLGPLPVFGKTRLDVGGQNLEGITIPTHPARTARIQLAPDGCLETVPLRIEPRAEWGATLEQNINVTASKSRMIDGLAPAVYGISMRKTGGKCFLREDPTLDARADRSAPLTIATTAGGTVTGEVEAEPSKRAGLLVMLMPADRTESGETVDILIPAADGTFEVTGMRPGRYRAIAVGAARGGAQWTPLAVTGAATVRLRLRTAP